MKNNLEDLKKFTDTELIARLHQGIQNERHEMVFVVSHLSEAYRRELYLKQGFSSLYLYARDYLHYANGSAYRRSNCARLILEFPEALEALANGELSLCTAAEAWDAFQRQKIIAREQKKKKEPPIPVFNEEEKAEAVHSLFGKSKLEATREIRSWTYTSEPKKERGQFTPVTRTKTELRVILEKEEYEDFVKLQEILSHQIPDMDPAKLLAHLVNLGLEKYDPKRKAARAEQRAAAAQKKKEQTQENTKTGKPANFSSEKNTTPAKHANFYLRKNTTTAKHANFYLSKNATTSSPVNTPRTPIPETLKREVFIKYHQQCAHCDPQTGQRCQEKRYLHIDHIHPVSLGGKSALENLQVLCSQHNLWKSDRIQPF